MRPLGTSTFSQVVNIFMALTRISRLTIVFVSSLVVLALMMASVDPEIQYSVDELMDDPRKFEESSVFVRGIVSPDSMNYDDLIFILSGNSHEILVNFANSPIPDGFDEGRTISVRGNMVSNNGNWMIDSYEIQTGCPSKYEA